MSAMRYVEYLVRAEIVERPVDSAWMALVLQWLRQWTFTPYQAEHLMAILRGQTRTEETER